MERDRRDDRDGLDPALDPARDPRRWERLVSGIVEAAAPELARRRAALDVPGLMLQWARPALAAAGAVALLVTGAALLEWPGSTVEAREASVAGAVVPESYAAWLVAGYEPTVTELVVALEEVER